MHEMVIYPEIGIFFVNFRCVENFLEMFHEGFYTASALRIQCTVIGDVLDPDRLEVSLEKMRFLSVERGSIVAVEDARISMPGEYPGEGMDVVVSTSSFDDLYLGITGESVYDDQNVRSIPSGAPVVTC